MSDDAKPIVPVNERPKPRQLRREDLRGLTPEEITAARKNGQLQDLLSGVKPPAAPAPPVETDKEKIARHLREGRS
jgi:hypothetical protein